MMLIKAMYIQPVVYIQESSRKEKGHCPTTVSKIIKILVPSLDSHASIVVFCLF